jgi:hypothetical protein
MTETNEYDILLEHSARMKAMRKMSGRLTTIEESEAFMVSYTGRTTAASNKLGVDARQTRRKSFIRQLFKEFCVTVTKYRTWKNALGAAAPRGDE